MHAAYHGHAVMARTLLQAGADTKLQNCEDVRTATLNHIVYNFDILCSLMCILFIVWKAHSIDIGSSHVSSGGGASFGGRRR